MPRKLREESIPSLQLTRTTRFDRFMLPFGTKRGRFDRAAEALWLAAERHIRQKAAKT
jgi:hypothetical protein